MPRAVVVLAMLVAVKVSHLLKPRLVPHPDTTCASSSSGPSRRCLCDHSATAEKWLASTRDVQIKLGMMTYLVIIKDPAHLPGFTIIVHLIYIGHAIDAPSAASNPPPSGAAILDFG